MTRKLIYFFLFSMLTISFLSCGKKKIEIPATVLPKEKMVPVIVDIHLAQAAAVIRNPSDSLHYTFGDYLPYILKLHDIPRAEYDSSISFYTSHPELMKEIYDDVINELSKKQSEVKTEKIQIK
jgi:hypothetical protein